MPNKGAVLPAGRPELVSEVPKEAELIVDFGRAPFDERRLSAFAAAGHALPTPLFRVDDLSELQERNLSRPPPRAAVALMKAPEVGAALDIAPILAAARTELILPLESEEHGIAVRLLSSVGVRVRINVAVLATFADPVLEVMLEAVMAPGPRAPVTPFHQLRRCFMEEHFELGQLDWDSRDHFVDLRTGEVPKDWQVPDADARRVALLLEQGECAFCEGLLVCYGHLKRSVSGPARCKEVLSEFVQMLTASKALDSSRHKGRHADLGRQSY